MSKRADLKNHINSLQEIKNIVTAMKNLSLIEINKLHKFIFTQDQVVTTIEEAAADFITFNPLELTFLTEPPRAYILIGSERGFCGNFNEVIIERFLQTKKMQANHLPEPLVVLIGRKLNAKMATSESIFKSLDGPNAVEEIEIVIANLVKIFDALNQQTANKINPGNWVIVFNEELKNNVQTNMLRPLHKFGRRNPKSFSHAPVLNLKPDEFLTEMLYQYFFAILHQILYQSFMAENRQRLLHMEGAIRWLENNSERLILNYNRLRQNEITEEIEVILLSAAAVIEEIKNEE